MDAREIMKACYGSPNCKSVLATASARVGSPCWFIDNPIDGVCVVRDDGGTAVLVALDAAEQALLLLEVGKAFAKLLRL